MDKRTKNKKEDARMRVRIYFSITLLTFPHIVHVGVSLVKSAIKNQTISHIPKVTMESNKWRT